MHIYYSYTYLESIVKVTYYKWLQLNQVIIIAYAIKSQQTLPVLQQPRMLSKLYNLQLQIQ